MDESNKKQFATLFYGLAEEFGGNITKNGVQLKFEALKHYKIDVIVGAANWIIRNRKQTFPPIPTVSEFISAIKNIENPLSIEDVAEMQAAAVINKLNKEGSSARVCFEDPITQSIMTDRYPYNAWAREVLTNDLKWWKKDFIALYMSYGRHVDAGLLIADSSKKLIPASRLNGLLNYDIIDE